VHLLYCEGIMSNLVEKWEKSGLLQNITSDNKYKVARGLENQAQWLLFDDSVTEYAQNFCLPVAKNIMFKLGEKFKSVELPAYIAEEDGKAHVVQSSNYVTRLSLEEVKNITPELIDKYSTYFANELVNELVHLNRNVIHLHTPIRMYFLPDVGNFAFSWRGNVI
jgi:hypothetical protein